MNMKALSPSVYRAILVLCLLASLILLSALPVIGAAESETEKIAVDTPAAKLLPTISSFLEGVTHGKIDQAYEESTSKEFKQVTSKAAFQEFVKKYNLEKSSLFQSHSFYIEGKVATFAGSLISESGKETPVEIDLVQEQGKWKIKGLQFYRSEIDVPRPEK